MTRTEFMAATGANLNETPLLYLVDGYKYQTRNDMVFVTSIHMDHDIITDLIILRQDGWLWVGKYFAWDGCSGPTIDDSKNMCAGLAHDALYSLMRMGLLPIAMRGLADDELRRLMIRDCAYEFRANYYKWAVHNFAAGAASREHAHKVRVAPARLLLNDLSPR